MGTDPSLPGLLDGWKDEEASAQPVVETLVKPRVDLYLGMPGFSVKPLLSQDAWGLVAMVTTL